MKLLFILLSVMTLTVQDKHSVSCEGSVPTGLDIRYECTYQKGTVRSGDSATLELTYPEGLALQQIEVHVRSNKNAGAGAFTVTADEACVAKKEGTFADWCGSYDNEYYHPVALLNTPVARAKNLSVSLVGTTNSLYIEKYVITYGAASACTVTLMKGSSRYATLTESAGGQGVMLPMLPDTAEWHFAGWSPVHFWTCDSTPQMYQPNNVYHPMSDCTLWAVYRLNEPQEDVYASVLEDGAYRYVNREKGVAMSGLPSNGRMVAMAINGRDDDQLYWIDFTEGDTAFITHVATGTPIGYSGTNLAMNASPWLVYHQDEETIFYTINRGKKYVLWLNVWDASAQSTYVGLVTAEPKNSPLALLLPTEEQETVYTCHPDGTQDIVTSGDEQSSFRGEQHSGMIFGGYELIIVNGRKELKIKN